MKNAEFDRVASNYREQHAESVRLSGESPDFFADYKIHDLSEIADREGIKPSRILDFGSGIGNSVRALLREFPDAKLTCLDVSSESLSMSQAMHGPVAEYIVYDGSNFPDEIGNFDIVFTACVFHHIDRSRHVDILRQIRTHLKPGGIFVLFEHNPWNLVTRHVVNQCPFDENAELISAPEMQSRMKAAGFSSMDCRFRIFFPGPFSRLRPLEKFLTWLPLGAQYSIVAR